ncbi:MAG TPA: Obg family GTPase CgtA, partial [Candidatus Saccharimonadia bacterium]|nr:Obg family GTPase CgtA [Candidatus Saccharimonadia bacterium]
LTKKPEVIALTKIDNLDPKILKDKLDKLTKKLPKNSKIVAISAVTNVGTKDLVEEVKKIVISERQKQNKIKVRNEEELPIIKLSPDKNSWNIKRQSNGFLITGHRIEKFASRTDFSNNQSIERIIDIMKKMGIMRQLHKMGIKDGDQIYISDLGVVEF